MADDKTNLLTEDLALLKNYMNSFYQRGKMADRYQKQIYFPKEEEEILKEINIRSEQVIEKFKCSSCKRKSFLWLFFSSKRLQLWYKHLSFEKWRIKTKQNQKDSN